MGNNERRGSTVRTTLPAAALWLAACAIPEPTESAAEPGPAAPLEALPIVANPPKPTPVISAMVAAEAVRQGSVPPALALAVAKVASNFAPNALGAAGTAGTMQIRPSLAEEFDVQVDDLDDAATNIRAGIACLAALGRRYAGDWRLALSHYRGGPLRQVDGVFVRHPFTRRYVRDVLRWWRIYRHDPITAAWLRKAQGLPRFEASNGGVPRTIAIAAKPARPQAELGGRWRPITNERRFR